jgi:hypothetical protein
MIDLPKEHFTSQPLQVQQIALSHAVGNCLMAWAQVEHTLHEKFVTQLVRQSRNKQRFVIARAVWSAVISFEARLRMVDAAIGGTLFQLETKRCKLVASDWRLLKNYTARMSSLRNEIAHGTMMNFDNKEMKIVPYATAIPFREGISIIEVYDRTNLFNELDKALNWHDLAFSSLWKPPLRRLVLNQQPIPDLILRLRAQAAQGRGDQNRKQKKAPRRTSRRK